MAEALKASLCCCEQVLLDEIANKQVHQRDVSQTYRLALESHEANTLDWGKVAGLKRIKEMAWSGKCFAATKGGT